MSRRAAAKRVQRSEDLVQDWLIRSKLTLNPASQVKILVPHRMLFRRDLPAFAIPSRENLADRVSPGTQEKRENNVQGVIRESTMFAVLSQCQPNPSRPDLAGTSPVHPSPVHPSRVRMNQVNAIHGQAIHVGEMNLGKAVRQAAIRVAEIVIGSHAPVIHARMRDGALRPSGTKRSRICLQSHAVLAMD